MSVLIKPSVLSGQIDIPCSKSMAHRLIICAALSKGESFIHPVCHSADIDATISAVKTLGAEVTENKDGFIINGIGGKTVPDNTVTIDCGESGSTARFLIPVVAALGITATFMGCGRLPERPLDDITNVLQNNGVNCTNNRIPLTVSGKLMPAQYSVSGKVSSQFLSGLLFAMPIVGNCCTVLDSTLESADYVKMTESALKLFNIYTENNGLFYKSSGDYHAAKAEIEGDWSQCSFYLSAAAMGADIAIKGLVADSLQGDKKAIGIFEKLGASVKNKDGLLYVCGGGKCESELYFDCRDIPDAVPSIAAAAAFKKGTITHITNAERLRFKESDRIKTTVAALKAIGANAVETSDGIIITGNEPNGGNVDGANDHRIVMAFAVAAAFARKTSVITDEKSVNKSYPNFFKDYKNLGGNVNVINNGKKN